MYFVIKLIISQGVKDSTSMQKVILIFVFIFYSVFKSEAQFTELGMTFGESHYLGDMTVHKLGDFKEAHVAYGLVVRNTFAKGYLSLRAGLTFAKISGNDKDFSSTQSLYYRNLNFQSYVQDLNVNLEVNLPGISPCEGKFFSPYITGGVSVFHFNPIAEYFGRTVNLQSLGTEGQGIAQFGNKPKYSLIQPSFPIGFGLKILCRDIFVVSLEVLYHYTLTDYLDDVSTNYYDPAMIAKYNGTVAAYMSNRSTYKIKYDANGTGSIKRGDATSKDAFFVNSITITYLISQRCGRNFKGLNFRKGGGTRCATDF